MISGNSVRNLFPMTVGISGGVFATSTLLSFGVVEGSPSHTVDANVRAFFILCSILAWIFSLSFSWFMAEFHCRSRSREIALGSMLGVRARTAFAGLWREFALSETLAGAAGLAATLVLNRFFSLVLGYLMREPFPAGRHSFGKIAGLTSILVAAQILVAALAIRLSIRRVSADCLFRPERRGERARGSRRTWIGAALIAVGYSVSMTARARTTIPSMLTALASVLSGTFLFLEGFLRFALRRLKGENGVHRPPFLLAVSRLSFDLGRSANTLAVATIFAAIAVTAGGVIFSLASNEKIQVDRVCPNGLELTGGDIGTLSAAVTRIRGALDSGTSRKSRPPAFRLVESLNVDLSFPGKGGRLPGMAISFSDWNALMEDSGRETAASPADGEITGTGYFSEVPGADPFSRVVVRIKNGSTVEGAFRLIREGYALASATGLRQVILSDADWKRLSASTPPPGRSYSALWNPEDPAYFRTLGEPFESALAEVSDMGFSPALRIDAVEEYGRVAGALSFMGVLLMSAFLTLAISALSFWLWGNVREEQARLGILDALGARARDTERSIRIYAASTFSIPLLLGSLHSVFALRMFARLSRFAVVSAATIALGFALLVFAMSAKVVSARYLEEAAPPS